MLSNLDRARPHGTELVCSSRHLSLGKEVKEVTTVVVPVVKNHLAITAQAGVTASAPSLMLSETSNDTVVSNTA